MRRYACLPVLLIVTAGASAAAAAQQTVATSVEPAGGGATPVAPPPSPPQNAAPAPAVQATAPADRVIPAVPSLDPTAQRDPLERFNRVMWGFDRGLDAIVLKPVATVYRTVTPHPARRGLSHIIANLTEPWSAINALLQGKPKRAFNSLGRFVINTTIGVGGLADHASELGLRPTPEDFGETLAAWGAKTSTYIVLPLFGPSTIRDGIGTGVESFADPVNIAIRNWSGLTRTQRLAVPVFEAVDARANLIDSGADALLASSADPYATARSAYLQRRAAQIADQDDASTTGNAAAGDASVDAALKELNDDAGPATPPGAAAPAPAAPSAPSGPASPPPQDGPAPLPQ